MKKRRETHHSFEQNSDLRGSKSQTTKRLSRYNNIIIITSIMKSSVIDLCEDILNFLFLIKKRFEADKRRATDKQFFVFFSATGEVWSRISLKLTYLFAF